MDDLGERHESLKIHKQIPIYIVEDHHHVMPFIHENIRKRFLPIKGNTFVHLDSHPDMLIPKKMPADHAYDPEKLYEAHDIENWIMPNCYTGILHHLVWVKPPWANQIKGTHQKIYIGKCKSTSLMRLECKENYYVSEELFMLRKDMEAIRPITLDCLTLGSRLVDAEDDIQQMKQISESISKSSTILDIDLDFFSTTNPFLGLYDKADLYVHLQSLFRFNPPKSDSDVDILASQQERIAQLGELETLFNHLNEHNSLPILEGQTPSARYTEVASLVEALREFYDDDEIDWMLILDGGCTIDDRGLPHNISTMEELDVMFKSFENFLDIFSEAPRIITISRSSSDEYTPPDQVEYIQSKVLEILNLKFVCASPVLHYLEMDADEEILDTDKVPNV
ncbi:hypothetical protein WA026_017301 [Henosepilachna vigintioctopunctata]|uniref:Uncharacterized protein n=1 Tax=Henosepilachna vigintioctopunctata TaxID=420089 RepID=A0AAW1UGE9_9CUCU